MMNKADGRILHVYMKSGGPTPISATATKRLPSAPQADTVDLTQNNSRPSEDRRKEGSDRAGRGADPHLQDGSYGFGSKEDQMDVDTETSAPPPREYERRNEQRGSYHGDRYARGGERYGGPSRDYGRGGYYDRGWSGGRPRESRRQYSDQQYAQYPARGYR